MIEVGYLLTVKFVFLLFKITGQRLQPMFVYNKVHTHNVAKTFLDMVHCLS